MPSYMLLIIEPTDQRAQRTQAQGEQAYASMQRFGEQLHARGVLRGVESLAGHGKAARVRVREGRAEVRDGPFAEAKEMIGGFFLLDCESRAQALEIAAQCPAAQWCTVELRELAPCHDESRA